MACNLFPNFYSALAISIIARCHHTELQPDVCIQHLPDVWYPHVMHKYFRCQIQYEAVTRHCYTNKLIKLRHILQILLVTVYISRNQDANKCKVQFVYTRLLNSIELLSGVSRVVYGHSPISARSQWMLHWWRADSSSTRELFPCTHPSTPSTRLGRPLVPFFKSFGMTWPGIEPCPPALNQLGTI